MTRDDFDKKFDYYSSKRESLGLTSVWSIYEVDSLDAPHPFGDEVEVAYVKGRDHWGDKTVAVKAGKTWADLYVAADKCIRDSGDNHHIYIENFIPSSINSKILFLTTGS